MNFSNTELDTITERCASYQQKKMITHVSTLLYGLSKTGEFVNSSYGQPHSITGTDYTYSKLGAGGLGIDVMPHVFCDGTQPNTCEVPECLAAAIKNPLPLFEKSISEARYFGWKGYILDFEEWGAGDYTGFFEDWATHLAQKGLKLYVWNRLNNVTASAASNSSISGVFSMNTYGAGTAEFEQTATQFLQSVPAPKAGLGLITYADAHKSPRGQTPDSAITSIGEWCRKEDVATLAIWSNQQIPPAWETGLQDFLGTRNISAQKEISTLV